MSPRFVVFQLVAARKRICSLANARADKAISSAQDIIAAPFLPAKRKIAVAAKTVPLMNFGTQWTRPSLARSTQLRNKVIKCIWGNSSQLRCNEVVLAILNDPTKYDPFFSGALSV